MEQTSSPIKFRQAKSEVDFIPTREQVLCKFTYLVSPTAIVSEKIPHTQYRSVTVAGYGELTSEIEIGDVVAISQNIQSLAPFLVDIPSNKYSVANSRRMFDLLTKDEIANMNKVNYRVSMIDYFVIPIYDIVGYYKSTSEDGKYIISLQGNKVFTRDQALDRFNLSLPNTTKVESTDDVIY